MKKQLYQLILFILLTLSNSKNLFFQWRITDIEKVQLDKELRELFESNTDLYEMIIEKYKIRYQPKDDSDDPLLGQHSTCDKCISFSSSLNNIRLTYGFQAIYSNLKTGACTLLNMLNILDDKACKGLIDSYIHVFVENFFSKFVNNHFFCEKFELCKPSTPKKYLNPDTYAKELLRDKIRKGREEVDPSGRKLKMLHVTDIHYDPYYKEGRSPKCKLPICCRVMPTNKESEGDEVCGKFGYDGSTDIGEDLFNSFLDDAVQRQPDLILWTGDNIPHDSYDSSQDEVYEISRKLRDKFNDKFRKNGKKIPIYYSIGNHEKYPNDDYKDTNDQALLSNLAEIYKEYLSEEAYNTFKNYGYYSMRHEDTNLRIISLNCLLCDNFNFNLMNSTQVKTKEMLSWLENELKKAESNNEFVYILNHFPINGEFTWTECSKRFQALFDRFEYTVRGVFSGHTHRDDTVLVSAYFNNKKYTNINFVAPQLTTYKDKYPSYRVYIVDERTKLITNYEQYRIDLEKSNMNKIAYWNLGYIASDFYKVSNMLDYDSLARFKDMSGYVYNQYSGSRVAMKYKYSEDLKKYAKCVMTSCGGIDEIFKCYNPPFGLKMIYAHIMTDFLLGPFEE